MKSTIMRASVSLVAIAITTALPTAQGNRPASPAGASATQIGGNQLTWNFIDVTDTGGAMAIMRDKTMASVPFKVGQP